MLLKVIAPQTPSSRRMEMPAGNSANQGLEALRFQQVLSSQFSSADFAVAVFSISQYWAVSSVLSVLAVSAVSSAPAPAHRD